MSGIRCLGVVLLGTQVLSEFSVAVSFHQGLGTWGPGLLRS